MGKPLLALSLLFALTISLRAQQDDRAVGGVQPSSAGATPNQRPTILQHVGIDQHLNQQLPLDLPFRDEAGKAVRLGNYFDKRPVILGLVYYRCPMLSGEVVSGLTSAIRVVCLAVGSDSVVA